ncbi:MAG: phosphate ABC transporter permease PstA [Microthrixaceae bacterium]
MTIAFTRRRQREATAEAVRRAITQGGVDRSGLVFKALVASCLAAILALLLWLLEDVVAEAQPYLAERGLAGFLGGTLSSQPATYGVSQGIIGSVWILIFVAVLAFPIGVAAGIYLEEYATDSRSTRLVNLVIRNLAGVPSVVYGILGLAVFKELLGGAGQADAAWWQFTGGPTLITAGLTMSILVLPIVIITSAEAIRAVPQSLREAGFGVGATRSEVIRSHVLPYAAPGILTGTVLSFARAIGEAAPLLMVGAITGLLPTYGTVPDQLTGKFTALPMVIYGTLKKPETQGWPAVTASVILVLMAVLLTANAGSIMARNYFERKRQ